MVLIAACSFPGCSNRLKSRAAFPGCLPADPMLDILGRLRGIGEGTRLFLGGGAGRSLGKTQLFLDRGDLFNTMNPLHREGGLWWGNQMMV